MCSLQTGLVFVTFGPSYSYVLLRLIYSQTWSDGDATAALGCYCIYVFALALNGELLYTTSEESGNSCSGHLTRCLLTTVNQVRHVLLHDFVQQANHPMMEHRSLPSFMAHRLINN
jgi:hypothetical protein